MKKLLSAICIFVLIFSLSACTYIEEEDAKLFVEEYLELLEEENYDEIELKSHFYETDIVEGLKKLEDEANLDFQAGIEIIEYTGFKSQHSDSYYGKPICELTINTKIGGVYALMEVCVIDNEGVFNVCDIYITVNSELFGIS